MLGNAKPYFTLIAQSPNRAEIEQAAASYEKSHPGTKVVIDHWRDPQDEPARLNPKDMIAAVDVNHLSGDTSR